MSTSAFTTEQMQQLTQMMAGLMNTKAANTGLDSGMLEKLAAAMTKPTKQTRKRKEVATDCLCMARVGTGSIPKQCSLAKTGDSDYCTNHARKAAQTEVPLSYDEAGNKTGLFFGRVDQPVPWKDAEGRVVIQWNDPALKKEWSELEASGKLVWAPNTAPGRAANGEPKPKKEKKTKKEKPVKEPKAKGKRVGSAYFLWLNEKNVEDTKSRREIIKAALIADGVEVKTQAPICKRAGEMWKAMSEQEKKPYQDQIDTLKISATAELQVHVPETPAAPTATPEQVIEASPKTPVAEAPISPLPGAVALDELDEDDEEGEAVDTEPVEGHPGLVRIKCPGHEMDGKVITEDEDQTVMVPDGNGGWKPEEE